MFCLNTVAVNRSARDAIMNAGDQNMAVNQPDEVFAAGYAGDIHRIRQLIGGKLIILMRIDPLTQRTQRLRR